MSNSRKLEAVGKSREQVIHDHTHPPMPCLWLQRSCIIRNDHLFTPVSTVTRPIREAVYCFEAINTISSPTELSSLR